MLFQTKKIQALQGIALVHIARGKGLSLLSWDFLLFLPYKLILEQVGHWEMCKIDISLVVPVEINQWVEQCLVYQLIVWSFATLPPHFCRKDLEKLNSIGWNNICPGHQNYPECFKLVIPFLFASLLYHHAWLETTFSPQHPIFQQSCLSNTYSIDGINQPIKNLQKNVLLGINQCLDTNMVATGIPDHLAIAHEVQEL